MSKRKSVVDYYKRDKAIRLDALNKQRILNELYPLTKSSASVVSDRYQFAGEAIVRAAIVRADLNGYSKWANGEPLKNRAELLDDFFSQAVTTLDSYKGVYFRDEGDCIVSIFSPHFDPNFENSNVKNFCKAISSRRFGKAELTAKCSVSVGDVAIFQKNHEIGTDDWSAEGHAFVMAARLEQTVESKACIYYFKEDFDNYFNSQADYTGYGGSTTKATWQNETINLQVPGVGNSGGWTEISMQEYIGD